MKNQYIACAAIDFGSGSLKIQMSLVDPNMRQLVGAPLLSKHHSLGITEDVSKNNGNISKQMEDEAVLTLMQFKEEAQKIAFDSGFSAVHFKGIATAVFRAALNGAAVLNRLDEIIGIKFDIISQEEEGKLGFQTAQAVYQDVPEPFLLSWDSGSGSFQITSKENHAYEVFQGPLGHGTVRLILFREIRQGPVLKTHESGNPITKTEAVALNHKISALLPEIPTWLQDKFNHEEVVVATYGDHESIFSLVAQALAHAKNYPLPAKYAHIALADVKAIIDTYIDSEDHVFEKIGIHRKTVAAAIHLSTLMQYFGMEAIHYRQALGNTPGILLNSSNLVSITR